MFPSTKAAALAAGFVAVISIVSLAPRLDAQQAPKADPETLVIEDARVDWIEKSSVAATREGIIERMELQIGMPVARGRPIGYLKSEMAVLAVKKAQTAVEKTAPTAKAKAQKELATAIVAINKRLNERIKGAVSQEEMMKAEAEMKVAHALTIEAAEQLKADQVELELAKQALEEHTIISPFDGIVIERMKNPGEKVGQAEPVVQIGNINRLRSYAFIPAEYAYRVKEGDVVDLQPRLAGSRSNPLAIEQKRFRGKITFVDPQIQPEGETAVRIYAEFENRDHDLRPGLKGTLTVYLGTSGAAPATAPTVGARIGATR
jgi:RND family efflux transporter MFP subunit